MTTCTLPPVTPAFQAAVRALAMEVGYRNACKAIIYGPTQSAPVAVVHVQMPTRTRNQFGHKDKYGLPGPNPPRNKAGGFTCPTPGGYERSGPGMAYSSAVTTWNSDPKPGCPVVKTGDEAMSYRVTLFQSYYHPDAGRV
jgi:hypothetical protein